MTIKSFFLLSAIISLASYSSCRVRNCANSFSSATCRQTLTLLQLQTQKHTRIRSHGSFLKQQDTTVSAFSPQTRRSSPASVRASPPRSHLYLQVVSVITIVTDQKLHLPSTWITRTKMHRIGAPHHRTLHALLSLSNRRHQ